MSKDSSNSSFYERFAWLILVGFALATPVVFFGAARAVGSNSNRVEDWLVQIAPHQPDQDEEIERLRPDGEPIDEHGLLAGGSGDDVVPERVGEDENHRDHEAVDGRGFDHRQTDE